MSAQKLVIIALATTIKILAVFLLLLLARGTLWLFNMLLVAPLFDPLKNLVGPDGAFLQNHFSEVMDPKKSPRTHEDWKKQFGNTFRFHGFGKHDYRLMSFDFRAVSHVLNSNIYEKPWQTRSVLARLIGRGIFSTEGTEHKNQRRLIGPAFTAQSVKTMTPIFFQKAEELCERWDGLLNEPFYKSNTCPSDPPPAYAPFATVAEKIKGVTMDVSHWLSRASFDVIGLTGFNYHFNSLENETEDVYLAYRRMFNIMDKGAPMRTVLELYFPIIRKLWPDERTRITEESLRVVDKAGKKLIADKKAAITMKKSDKIGNQDKDILSLLIKANLSSDPSKRLSNAELIDQCSTFLLAGSDSVSVALSWALHFLSLNPDMQTRLRNEILSLSTLTQDTLEANIGSLEKDHSRRSPPPSYPAIEASPQENWEGLESLSFLDAVVRETLRLSPPVHATIRVAMRDDLIPVSQPVILQDGTHVEKDGFISIRKGSYIHIPIEGLNLSEDIWGNDAREFKPDRWTNLPTEARSPAHPGLGNMMTFGFGPHSCLGYKFTIAEMKVFLGVILSQFVFSPEPGTKISKFNTILTRPYVVDKWELGTQLPLVVSRYAEQ